MFLMLQNYAEKARQTRKHYLFLHFLTIRTDYVKSLNYQLNIIPQKLRVLKREVNMEVKRGVKIGVNGYHSHNTPVSTSKRLHINNPGSQTQSSVPGVSQSQHTVNPEGLMLLHGFPYPWVMKHRFARFITQGYYY